MSCDVKHRKESARRDCPNCKQRGSTKSRSEKPALASVIAPEKTFTENDVQHLNEHVEDYRDYAKDLLDDNTEEEETTKIITEHIQEDLDRRVVPGLIYHDEVPESDLDKSVKGMMESIRTGS